MIRRIILFGLFLCIKLVLSGQSEDSVFVKSLLLNDRTIETSVAFLPDGEYLYFSRRGAIFNFGKENNSDIWLAKSSLEGLSWSAPVNAGPQINTAATELVVCTNTDASRLYFTRTITNKKILFSIEKDGRRWGLAEEAIIPGIDSFTQVKSYFVSLDEQILLLCAVPKGAVKANIYYCLRDAGNQWTAPTLLPLPNWQAGDERTVFLGADNRSLFFASNGPNKDGNYDLFYSKRIGPSWQNWSEVSSMGDEINTPSNEYGLTMPVSGKIIAYISDARGGKPKVLYAVTPSGLLPDENN